VAVSPFLALAEGSSAPALSTRCVRASKSLDRFRGAATDVRPRDAADRDRTQLWR